MVIYLCTPYSGSTKHLGVSIRTRFFGCHGLDVIRVMYVNVNLKIIRPVDAKANAQAMADCMHDRMEPNIFVGFFFVCGKKSYVSNKQHEQLTGEQLKLDGNSNGWESYSSNTCNGNVCSYLENLCKKYSVIGTVHTDHHHTYLHIHKHKTIRNHGTAQQQQQRKKYIGLSGRAVNFKFDRHVLRTSKACVNRWADRQLLVSFTLRSNGSCPMFRTKSKASNESNRIA